MKNINDINIVTDSIVNDNNFVSDVDTKNESSVTDIDTISVQDFKIDPTLDIATAQQQCLEFLRIQQRTEFWVKAYLGKQIKIIHCKVNGDWTDFSAELREKAPAKIETGIDENGDWYRREIGEAKDEHGKNIWSKAKKKYDEGFKFLSSLTRGFNTSNASQIFIIPNQLNDQGIADTNTEYATSIYAEIDHLSLDEQKQGLVIFAAKTGLVPSIVIYSGGKSLHTYFCLEQGQQIIDMARFKAMQRRLIILLEADIHIQNSNREMRLPGFYRSNKDKWQQISVKSEHRYTEQELWDALEQHVPHMTDTHWKKYRKLRNELNQATEINDTHSIAIIREKITKLFSTPEEELQIKKSKLQPGFQTRAVERLPYTDLGSTEAPSLFIFLTKEYQELATAGRCKGTLGREPGLRDLALVLGGIAATLDDLGCDYSDDRLDILQNYADACSPPIPDQVDRHYEKALQCIGNSQYEDRLLRIWNNWAKKNLQPVTDTPVESVPEIRFTGINIPNFTSPSLDIFLPKDNKKLTVFKVAKRILGAKQSLDQMGLEHQDDIRKVCSQYLEKQEYSILELDKALTWAQNTGHEQKFNTYCLLVYQQWAKAHCPVLFEKLCDQIAEQFSFSESESPADQFEDFYLTFYKEWADLRNPKAFDDLRQALFEKQRKEVAKWTLNRKADILVPDTEQYLPKVKLDEINSWLFALKGSWGIGKTTLLRSLLEEARSQGFNILVIGHRNTLLRGLAKAFRAMHHEDAKAKGILQQCPDLCITDVSFAQFYCFDPSKPTILVIDEYEQVLRNAIVSKYLKSSRVRFYKEFEKIVKSAAKVFVADADLTDKGIEFLEEIKGKPNSAFLVQHLRKPCQGRKIKFTTDSDFFEGALARDIKEGLRILFCTDSKAEAQKVVRLLELEGRTVTAIHADTSDTAEIKYLVANLADEYTKLDNLVYNSSLETGADMPYEHFERRYCKFNGQTLNTASLGQTMHRYRPEIETLVYCLNTVRYTEIKPEKIIEDTKSRLQCFNSIPYLEIIDEKTGESSVNPRWYEIQAMLEQGYSPTWDKPESTDMRWLDMKAHIIARDNACFANPLVSLLDRLDMDGYEVEFVGLPEVTPEQTEEAAKKRQERSKLAIYNKAVGERNKEIKKQIQREKDEAIADAEVLDNPEYKQLITQDKTLTAEQKNSVEKTKLFRFYGGEEVIIEDDSEDEIPFGNTEFRCPIEIDADFVGMERRNKLRSKIPLLHTLYLDDMEVMKFDAEDIQYTPDASDRKYYSLRRNLLLELGILGVIAELEQGATLTKNSPVVQEVAKRCRDKQRRIKKILGVTINNKKDRKTKEYEVDEAETVNRILKLLGIKINGKENKKSGCQEYQLCRFRWKVIQTAFQVLDKRRKIQPAEVTDQPEVIAVRPVETIPEQKSHIQTDLFSTLPV